MKHTPISVAIIVHAGKILISRRPNHAILGGLWEFPGGKIEDGEASAAAAVRECREELGCEITVHGLFERLTYSYDHGILDLHFHLATLRNGLPPKSTGREWRLVDPAELTDYAFPEANAGVLARLAAEPPALD